MKIINQNLYKDIVKSMPIICIDLAILDIKKNGYLLVKRDQEPLMGEWWVPGGRLFQGESLVEAAKRKLEEEIGIDSSNKEFSIIGIYEDVFDKSSFENHLYHTISVVFNVEVEIEKEHIKLDNTSREWKVFTKLPTRLLSKLTSF